MSDPVLLTGYGQFYYLCDRDPTSTEKSAFDGGCYLDIPNFKYMWFNTTNNKMWWCTDNTTNAMVWQLILTDTNISTYLSTIPVSISQGGTDATTAGAARTNLGLSINSNRAPFSVSLALNTSRQPNTTHDVFVSANILFSAVVSLSAEIDILVSPDNSAWTTYGKAKQQISLAANIIQQLYALIPVGYYYKFVESGSGGSIDSIFEILM